jgi:hypothetical protein
VACAKRKEVSEGEGDRRAPFTHLDALLEALDLLRQVVDGIHLLASHSHPSTDAHRGPLGRQIVGILEVGREDSLESANGVVVAVDKLGKGSNASTDVNGGGRVWNLEGLEEGLKFGVGLRALVHLSDL